MFTLRRMLIVLYFTSIFIVVFGRTFRLFHTGDIESHFEESIRLEDGTHFGGCARISHVVKEARAAHMEGQGPPVLYLNAGNVFQGSIWFAVHRNKICSAFMNALMPDAMSLGPNELTYGLRELLPFVQAAKFPIVVSNLQYNKEVALERLIKDYIIVNVKGTQVGIVGYMQIPTYLVGTKRIGSLGFLDEVESVRMAVEDLTNAEVKIIIVLSSGSIKKDIQLAKAVNNIDIIVGGISKTLLWNGPAPHNDVSYDSYPFIVLTEKGNILIAHAYSYAKYLGNLLVTFDSRGILLKYEGQPIFLDEYVPQDYNVLKLLGTFRREVDIVNNTAVGQSKVFLDGLSCRFKDCNLGNLITDSFVQYYAKLYEGPYWSDVGVSLLNVGSIKGNINPKVRGHTVYKSDLLTVLPFNNTLYIVELLGSQIVHSLEIGAKNYEDGTVKSLIIGSGLKIVYNYANRYGHRVELVRIRCADCPIPRYSPLEFQRKYKVITTEFLVEGGDEHKVISERGRGLIALPIKDLEAALDYFDSYKPILQEVDNRIVMRNFASSRFIHHSALYLFLIVILNVCF